MVCASNNSAGTAWLTMPSASASLPDHFEKSKEADLNARLPMSPLGSMAKVGMPCNAASSTITFESTVLPEPVAPRIMACRVSDERSTSNLELSTLPTCSFVIRFYGEATT